jgi:hypothetical protein
MRIRKNTLWTAFLIFRRGFCVSEAAMATSSIPWYENAACTKTPRMARNRPSPPGSKSKCGFDQVTATTRTGCHTRINRSWMFPESETASIVIGSPFTFRNMHVSIVSDAVWTDHSPPRSMINPTRMRPVIKVS